LVKEIGCNPIATC